MALKSEILTLLEQRQGEPLSGAMLAERFSVSRNAVWKAVNALKEEGHLIESIGKRGYALSKDSDLISSEGVKGFLPESLADIKILTYKQVESTNDEAKKFCLSNPEERAVCIAEQQTAGRGRFGRSFYSPPETGLYLSTVTHPNKSIERAAVYTAAAAVAAVRAIRRETGVEPQIKWINDLYLGRQKICGILTEAITDFETGEVRSMVTGIGINITTEDFPENIRGKAASLGQRVQRNRLAAAIIGELYALYESEPSEFMDDYRRCCFLIGQEITFSDGRNEYCGKVADIGDGCELLLDSGVETLCFTHGEITEF